VLWSATLHCWGFSEILKERDASEMSGITHQHSIPHQKTWFL